MVVRTVKTQADRHNFHARGASVRVSGSPSSAHRGLLKPMKGRLLLSVIAQHIARRFWQQPVFLEIRSGAHKFRSRLLGR